MATTETSNLKSPLTPLLLLAPLSAAPSFYYLSLDPHAWHKAARGLFSVIAVVLVFFQIWGEHTAVKGAVDFNNTMNDGE